jgi:DNA-binding response OmpR family regulator
MKEFNRTILLVDDDEDDLRLLHDVCKDLSFNGDILEAHDGEEALMVADALQAASKPPCVIVLDVNMPRKDGKETLLALRANKALSGIPVLVFTTSTSSADKMFFAHYEAEMVPKPWDMSSYSIVAARILSYCAA